ncbi:MAG: MoxR family ATPase [Rhodospirillaceae bacterium]|nr:MoxR family ATPase [Rhodospirillaceae bacterium]MBT4428763.1 MoxR family ATPase [Rhodospirillaceae bacterium]MBT5777891.1 MoxR family ATPase [Rhodospirillaceae bacterium]MBT6829594.1 MoxR family ATPase [Rhodospirillaceae bacterium]MBT7291900.1 MoxR family ATPase [Rhodospirillaceae bacterium]
MNTETMPDSVESTRALLKRGKYVSDQNLATMLFLSLKLGRPLLLEGRSGVGKSELGMVLARELERPLLRLQCYEGLDASAAVYEWNYAAQMIEIRLAEQDRSGDKDGLAGELFSERFLIKRPLLQALEETGASAPVLLIDEIDRADEGFEAYLLEILSDFQISVPELGTIRAAKRPIVVLTSNRTREIHDALKRRCIYHWLDYPDAAQEAEILKLRAPTIARKLTESLDELVQELRQAEFRGGAGVKAAVEWAATLIELDREEMDPKETSAGIAQILKRHQDGEVNAVADALARGAE